ncbi:MAG: carotenoid biosynthesis protein [Acidobacteria bacterium]|nr:carotenoid biosynthesis protein [Acidobacteriota bacterium]MBW4044802.1 carotenoid biosynthesis protein [Acidobacteriota bacterium]
MSRAVRVMSWLLFLLSNYLIVAAAVSPWLKLPSLGNIGFTLVYVLFALFHCVAMAGVRRTALFFSISAVVSYLMEEVGVRTGFIYGAYHYSDLLGPKLGHVPLLIPLAWFMMIYPSWMVARVLVKGVDPRTVRGFTAEAVVAAWVMTAWDLVMDPGMSAAGNWIWEHGGAYFGVPRRNYLGWLLTTFLVYWIAGWMWRKVEHKRTSSRIFEALPVYAYAIFAARYAMGNRIPALQVVALFCMGTPALVALIRLGATWNEPADAGAALCE